MRTDFTTESGARYTVFIRDDGIYASRVGPHSEYINYDQYPDGEVDRFDVVSNIVPGSTVTFYRKDGTVRVTTTVVEVLNGKD